MKRLLAAVAFSLLLLAGGAGCCTTCPGRDVPVSLEGLYNYTTYFDASYKRFPHSTPPCPYYGPYAHRGPRHVHQTYEEVPTPTPAAGAPRQANNKRATRATPVVAR
jgi:hypothetical protein